MTSVEVHKAIERSLLRAFTINKAIRVPANEVERVQVNMACGHRHEIASPNVTRPKAGADDRK
jgi:hypothetical protein